MQLIYDQQRLRDTRDMYAVWLDSFLLFAAFGLWSFVVAVLPLPMGFDPAADACTIMRLLGFKLSKSHACYSLVDTVSYRCGRFSRGVFQRPAIAAAPKFTYRQILALYPGRRSLADYATWGCSCRQHNVQRSRS